MSGKELIWNLGLQDKSSISLSMGNSFIWCWWSLCHDDGFFCCSCRGLLSFFIFFVLECFKLHTKMHYHHCHCYWHNLFYTLAVILMPFIWSPLMSWWKTKILRISRTPWHLEIIWFIILVHEWTIQHSIRHLLFLYSELKIRVSDLYFIICTLLFWWC